MIPLINIQFNGTDATFRMGNIKKVINSAVTSTNNYGIGENLFNNIITATPHVAIGNNILTTITNSATNTAIGTNLARTSRGSGNTLIGNDCVPLTATSGLSSNIAIGNGVLSGTSKPVGNTGIGKNALFRTTDFATNFAIGIGLNSGYRLYCDGNTCIGVNSGPNFSSDINFAGAINNTLIGTNSGNLFVSDTVNTSFSNATSIGTNTRVRDSGIIFGTSSDTILAKSFNSISDLRDKTDITSIKYGLEFIESLHPVEYNYDYRENYTNGLPDGTKMNSKKCYGFIAQEVELIASDFGGIHITPNEYRLNYVEFIAPLVKAVQELSIENNLLLNRLNQIENILNSR